MTHSRPLLSVVVPVYNVALYLEECLTSLLTQGLNANELEVIIINDGSTDGSDLLASKWVKRHRNFHLISQKNSGLSAARNTGIKQASGDYIVFLDSDDIVPDQAYRHMLDVLLETGSDFITGAVQRLSRDGEVRTFNRTADLFEKTRKKISIINHPEYIRDTTPWNKMYKRQFILDSSIVFPDGRIYEDVATSPKFYWEATSFDVFSSPVYLWRVNDAGITQTLSPIKATDRLWAINHIKTFFAKRNIPNSVLHEYDFTIVDYNLRWIFLDLWKYDHNTQSQIINQCCQLIQEIDENTIKRIAQPIQRWALLAKAGKEEQLLTLLRVRQRSTDESIANINPLDRAKTTIIRYSTAFYRKLRAFKTISTRRIKKIGIYFIWRPIIWSYPINEKVAVFSSYWGRDFLASNGPPAICIELASKDKSIKSVVFASRDTYDTIVKSVHRLVDKDANIQIVRNHSFKYYYHLWTAKYLFNDVNFDIGMGHRFIDKRPGQVEIQTTHGIPLKKMGIDSEISMPAYTKELFIKKSKRYDYLVSSSARIAKIFSKSHTINPKILKTGLPQNDFLFETYSPQRIADLKNKYNIPHNKKVVVYAPTYRYKRGQEFHYLIDFNTLHEKLGDKYHIIIKTHPFNYTDLRSIDFRDITNFRAKLKNNTPFIQLFGKLKDTLNDTVYETTPADINELMLLCDIFITDYSSTVFSFTHLNKPLVMFTPDVIYYNSTRGSYFDIDQIAPGAVAKNTNELIDAILSASDYDSWHQLYSNKINSFKSEFVSWEQGDAANKILHEINLLSQS